MCLGHNERENIIMHAREATGDMIRNKAWKRAKTELEIMVDTLEETDQERNAEALITLIENFVCEVTYYCLHE